MTDTEMAIHADEITGYKKSLALREAEIADLKRTASDADKLASDRLAAKEKERQDLQQTAQAGINKLNADHQLQVTALRTANDAAAKAAREEAQAKIVELTVSLKEMTKRATDAEALAASRAAHPDVIRDEAAKKKARAAMLRAQADALDPSPAK
jgi:hypothetical protein